MSLSVAFRNGCAAIAAPATVLRRRMRSGVRGAFAVAAFAMLACAACAAPAGGAAPGDAARVPPMSTPFPAKRVASPPALVTACGSDADCAVKDVGSCCGAMPACVNRDSAVDAAAVRAQCAQDGRVGACGFREIQGCRCDAGQCRATDAPRLPPPPADARRR